MAKKSDKKEKKFEIMNHELVPQHMVISKKEEKELFEKYNIKPEQLPKILNDDPVVASIGADPGEIIKVIRKSQTANESIAYRLVVESGK